MTQVGAGLATGLLTVGAAVGVTKERLATGLKGAHTGIGKHFVCPPIAPLWKAALDLRKRLSEPVLFFTILVPKEYDDALKSEYGAPPIHTVTQESLNEAIAVTSRMEELRPFTGELLWLRFFIYRAFLCRLTYLILDGKRSKHIGDWRKDGGVQQLLSYVTSESVQNVILRESREPLAMQKAVNTLEGLLLEEMSLIISGRRSSEESFENSRKLREAVASYPVEHRT